MRRLCLIAALAASSMISSAAGAVNIVSAKVSGPTGTVWDTTQNGFYTLFLQQPGLGDFLNPNDEAINAPITAGDNEFLTAGDGWVPGGTLDSDVIYTLAVSLSNGLTLLGDYMPGGNSFVSGGAQTFGGFKYQLTDGSWRRNRGDSVSQYVAVPGGDPRDYSGDFELRVAAVPEPATWAMMIGGFGLVGAAARRSSRSTRIQQVIA